jgi:hypothetical protein
MRTAAVLAAIAVSTVLQAADPVLLNLVMPDAKVVAGINVQRAKTSPFGQFLLNQMPAGSGLTEFAATTGFDPRQDLIEVLMAGNTEQKNGLVVARGTFNIAQISSAAVKDGKQVIQPYKGATLIVPVTTGSGRDTSHAIGFLSASIAIAGDLANVKAAIDRSTSNNVIDSTLAAKISSFSAADAWSVSIAPISSIAGDHDTENNPFGSALKTIQQASGSVTFSSPVLISAEALALSDQDATSLSDVLKFVVSLAMGNSDSAPFADLLKGLSVTTDHSTIKVQLAIPEDQLEQLLKTVPMGGPARNSKKAVARV